MTEAEFEGWLEQTPAEQHAALRALRALIVAAAPAAIEELKWSRPCYRDARGPLCYLHSTRGYATLGFERGAQLADPEGLLEGTGVKMRHLKLRLGLGPEHPGLRALLAQAVG